MLCQLELPSFRFAIASVLFRAYSSLSFSVWFCSDAPQQARQSSALKCKSVLTAARGLSVREFSERSSFASVDRPVSAATPVDKARVSSDPQRASPLLSVIDADCFPLRINVISARSQVILPIGLAFFATYFDYC